MADSKPLGWNALGPVSSKTKKELENSNENIKEEERKENNEEEEENLIANELRNTNKVLNIMEGHLGIIALVLMISLILTIIAILCVFWRF